jgi:eukaryotic-like serine/threonine-protein kinase
MDDSTKTLRAIFAEAAEISNASERAAFLVEACGADGALRSRVEGLLRAHKGAGGFLKPASDALAGDGSEPGTAPAAFAETTSQRIGRYKLLQRIGEGGCGIVYMAEQLEPVRRQIALKIIKLGMDTRSVIARFEAERQALALMDHPNIARVLDAGATDSGRPYFVMELVRGIRITDYCDQNQLTTEARLELFIQVCHAVQHAHQKGIIHRDIKPSNILITSHDGVPVPKVIDFGIAKATTDAQLTDKTLFTQFELFIGTPAYMSPEQAEMSGLGIDTRTDIYSLGVLLYELLTGRTPFDTDKLLKSGLDAMRRTIRETEPTRPSTRLRTLSAADLTQVAQHRRAEPPRLVSLVRGDLDWIVLKALEKDRARRYGTASSLAADIQQHLDDEIVGARPPSGLDRFQKLVRRNKVLFAAGSAVAVAVVVGLGISTFSYFKERQARREADLARVNETKQREQANANAEESRKRLVQLNVFSGNRLVDEGDFHGALLWFAEAMRLEQNDPAREDVHRRRFATVLRSAPALRQLWFHDSLVNSAYFNTDGTRVASSSLDHSASVWDALSNGPVVRLPHRTDLTGARFVPKSQRVVTIDIHRRLRFWNGLTGETQGDLFPTTAPDTHAVSFSPDARWMAVAVTNGVQLLNVTNGVPGLKLACTSAVEIVRFSPNGTHVAAAGPPGDLLIWDLQASGTAPRRLAHAPGLRGLAFTHDGRRLAAITLRELSVWNVDTGELAWPAMQPGGDLFDCRFSPDDRWLATASWDGRARVFDAASGWPVGDAMRHRGGVGKSVFSPNGQWLATVSWDGTARLWNARTGQPESPSLHHASYVMTADFNPDGTRLVTASQDKTVRLWELRTNSPARLTLRHGGPVTRGRFSPDGSRILTCGYYQPPQLWDARTGERLISFPLKPGVADGSFNADGKKILTTCVDGSAQVWDAERGIELVPAVRHTKILRHGEFSPDGKHFLTASDDGTARVWNAETGEPVTPFLQHGHAVRHAAFSPDGRRVITASFDKTAQLWDAQSGERMGEPLKHICEVFHAAFSPDGNQIVTACSDRSQLARWAYRWDAATGKAIGSPLPHLDGVFYAEYSPNGQFIATSGEDKSAIIWNASTGERLTPPLAHGSYVFRVVFSPDSRFVLTVSLDNAARVWEAATGEPITPPLAHDGSVGFGAWSPDGREVITASEDGTVRVWDISPTTKPLPDLKREAELLSGHRLEGNSGTLPLHIGEIKQRWEKRRTD